MNCRILHCTPSIPGDFSCSQKTRLQHPSWICSATVWKISLGRSHELYRLATLIDWPLLEQEFGALYSENGRPGIPIRLMAGLCYLSHAFKTSDEETVRRWLENPYHQYFCKQKYFCHELPIDPSSLSRFRKRIGEKDSPLDAYLAILPCALAKLIMGCCCLTCLCFC